MNPDSDPAEKVPEEGAESDPQAGDGLLQRLKQFWITDYLRTIDRLSRILKRLRSLVAKPKEEAGQEKQDDREARSQPSKTKSRASDEAAAAVAPPAASSPVRSILICLAVLIVGILVGMTFSFALLSNMVIKQAEKIGDQRDEISQLEKLHSKAVESEARYRNRLAEAESRLNQLARKSAQETEAPERAAVPPATVDKPVAAKKTADCALESGSPDKLAKCLEEFNRKTGR